VGNMSRQSNGSHKLNIASCFLSLYHSKAFLSDRLWAGF
jgi:hypothetical protein